MGGVVHAQQIAFRIPANAEVVAILNPKEILQQSNAKALNEILVKSGFFDNFRDALGDSVPGLDRMGLDLQQYMYAYHSMTDSISYTGYILPIADVEQVEHLLPDSLEKLPVSEGYQRRRNNKGTLFAWNKEVLYMLHGNLDARFLGFDSIAIKYGIDNTDMAADASYLDSGMVDSARAAEEYFIDEEASDSTFTDEDVVESILNSEEYISEVSQVLQDKEEVTFEAYPFDEILDTAYSFEGSGYSDEDLDSIRAVHDVIQQRNDSIRNELTRQWTEAELQNLIAPTHEAFSGKILADIHRAMPLARVWVKSMDGLYNSLLPLNYLSSMYLGFKPQSIRSGYKQAFFDIQQQQNILKINARVELDKELARVSKRVYDRKPNPRFFKYLTDSTMGFMSINVNSEAYMQEAPAHIGKYYSWLFGSEEEIISLVTTAIEIAFDEHALSKIMPGDNLILINGVTKLKTEYMEYEYDDEYNLKEIKRTKEDVVPRFIWMFTSNDQRLIVKGLQLAVSKEEARFADNIYEVPRKQDQSFPLYVLCKDDIIMLSNDRNELLAIQQNRLQARPNKSFERIVKNNVFSTALQPGRIPALLTDMDVPVSEEWRSFVDDLSQYGNVVISSKGVVKNEIVGEVSISLPPNDTALGFLLKKISSNLRLDIPEE